MAAVTSININGAGPQREQSQTSYHSSCGNFIKNDEELGQLNETTGYSDLYNALRPFLLLGKFIGFIPIQGLYQRDVDKLTKTSFPAILSIIIWGILGSNAVSGFVAISKRTHTNAGELAWVPVILVYHSIGLFAYIYFYRHISDYIRILRKWNKMMNLTFTKPDTTLFHDLNLMALVFMTLAAVEVVLNLAHQLCNQHMPEDSPSNQTNELENGSVLQNYYYNSWNQHWASLVPYHPLVAVVILISNTFVGFTCNYMDWTIAFISRALYHKFKAIHELGERLNDAPSQWQQLSSDLNVLCSMVFEIASFLSPMIFCSVGINVYAACLKLNAVLITTPNKTTIESIQEVWSVVHVVTKAYIVSICAARINDWARRLGETFRKCPSEAYTLEVQRAEQLVSLNTIGLHGLGCFLVTKPLMLQLAGVVLTFEIVLLQFSQTPSAGPVVCATS